MEIEIRPTQATDLPRLMGIDHSMESDSVWQLELRRDAGQIFATFREVRLPRPTLLAYPHSPFSLADEWVRRSMMYTGLSDGVPGGYLSIVARGPASVAWVTDLVVEPSIRRKGVAAALVSAAQHWASENSHPRLMLEMQSKNVPAIRMAQKLGFEFCGYNDHYYLTQDVALFFAKTVTPAT